MFLQFLLCDGPLFEDVEVSGAHTCMFRLHVAGKIQGGADPGGCDAAHWCDALLHYSAHCESICGILLLLLPVAFVILSCHGMMCVVCLPIDSLLLLINDLG